MPYEPPTEIRGGFSRQKTSERIKEYMKQNQPCYIGEIIQDHREWCKRNDYHYPSRQSLYSYFYLLKKLDLVVFDHEEETEEHLVANKRYYRLNEDKIDSEAWNDPRKAWNEMKQKEGG